MATALRLIGEPTQRTGQVVCADEPDAAVIISNIPAIYTAGPLALTDELFESWLNWLSIQEPRRRRLQILPKNLTVDNYVRHSTFGDAVPGWDGAAVAFSAVVIVDGAGEPHAVLILSGSDRKMAKALARDYLRWQFKARLGREQLKPGIFREVAVCALLYRRVVVGRGEVPRGPVAPRVEQYFHPNSPPATRAPGDNREASTMH